MQWRNSPERYGTVSRLLHWSMFAFIVVQLIGGEVLEELPKRTALRAFAFDAHETLGLVLLLLVFLRIGWRIASPAPPGFGPSWQQLAARAAHLFLYALLVAIPVSGYLMVSAKGHPAAFLALDVPSLVARDEGLARAAKEVHEALVGVLIAVVAIHVAAALWHQVVARDPTLSRMLPGRQREGFSFRH